MSSTGNETALVSASASPLRMDNSQDVGGVGGVGGVEGVGENMTGGDNTSHGPAEVLRAITDQLQSFLDFSYDGRTYNCLALWLAGTYVYDTVFKSYPQIFLEGSYQSGKSQTLEICSLIAKDGGFHSGITGAALRDLANQKRSLFLDEFDRVNGLTETILRAGYKDQGSVTKQVQDHTSGNWIPNEYDVYSPKMFASTSPLSVVNESRCIKIRTLRSTNPAIYSKQLLPADRIWDKLRQILQKFMNQNKNGLIQIYSLLQNGQGNYQGMQFSGRELELWNPIVALAGLFLVQPEIESFAVENITESRTQTATIGRDHIVITALKELVQQPGPDWYRGSDIQRLVIEEMSEDGHPTEWISPRETGQILRQNFPKLRAKRDKHGTLYEFNRDAVEQASNRIMLPIQGNSPSLTSTPTSTSTPTPKTPATSAQISKSGASLADFIGK